MDEPEMAPETLDAWLRAELGRRLAVTGVTLGAPADARDGTRGVIAVAGVAPAPVTDALAAYGEIWLRWLPAGTQLGETALRAASQSSRAYGEIWLRWLPAGTQLGETALRAAASDADALLLWLAAPPEAGMLAALHDALANLSLRDGCVLAVAGIGASRALARRLGYDDGFAPGTPPGLIATTLAREALALAAVRGGGSSPPCYL